MEDLRITLVQTSLYWEQKRKNLSHFGALLKGIKKGDTDLIVLPEMFNTGFSMMAGSLAEDMYGSTIRWMRKLAGSKDCTVTGSLIIRSGNRYYNRLIWMQPDGIYKHYDKKHLFSLANEGHVFTSGRKKLLVKLKGWTVCPQICYDLRFPVWNRNAEGYDLLIFVANWPKKRSFAWKQLLIARAIENQAFVAGVNRIGDDGNGIAYSGDSVVLDPEGKRVSKSPVSEEFVETIALQMDSLQKFREKLPFLKDADAFELISKRKR